MNWDRVNRWTRTLYALIHALHIAKQIQFGNIALIGDSISHAATWIDPACSYNSVLPGRSFRRMPKFRNDPNQHFSEITGQVVKMLVQDLVVILDEMMAEALIQLNLEAGDFPQSKIEKLSTSLNPEYDWARQGCLELVAVRNVLTHGGGRWNSRTIAIISSFVDPLPSDGDVLSIGFSMLFRYRRAIRTFLNEIAKLSHGASQLPRVQKEHSKKPRPLPRAKR